MYFAVIIAIYCERMAKQKLSKKERDALSDKEFEAFEAECKLWGEVRFLERLTSPKFLPNNTGELVIPNPDHLDFKLFNQVALQGNKQNETQLAVGLMCESDLAFDKENVRRKHPNVNRPPLERPTAQFIHNWINEIVIGGAPKAPKAMDRTRVQGLSSNSPNAFVKATAEAIDKNNDNLLNPCYERDIVANFVFGCEPEVNEVLERIVDTIESLPAKDQVAFLEACLVPATK